MPWGNVLLPQDGLRLVLPLTAKDKFEALDVRDLQTDRLVLSLAKPEGVTLIPTAQLKPENDYEWTVYVNGLRAQGVFHLIAVAERESVEKEVGDVIAQANNANGSVKAVLRAAVYVSHRLGYDAWHVLRSGKIE